MALSMKIWGGVGGGGRTKIWVALSALLPASAIPEDRIPNTTLKMILPHCDELLKEVKQ